MTTMGYGVNGLGSVPGRTRLFLLHSVQSCPGDHPGPYPMGTRVPSLGVKWPDHEADNSSLPGAKVKNHGAIPPLPDMSSWYIA
jgi:hypothetical protein